MRILVLSDSHGRVNPMLDAVDIYKPDAVFHLGDVVRDAEKVKAAYPKLPFYQVQGNCDHDLPGYETEGVARLGGRTIFYLHGHTRRVKLGIGPAVTAAKALGADILLFGHTHSPLHIESDGLLAVNPGAIQDRRCAVLSWEEAGEIEYFPVSL